MKISAKAGQDGAPTGEQIHDYFTFIKFYTLNFYFF